MLELCASCSAKVPASAKFCGSCGATRSGAPGSVAAAQLALAAAGAGTTAEGGEHGSVMVQLPAGSRSGQLMQVLLTGGPPPLPHVSCVYVHVHVHVFAYVHARVHTCKHARTHTHTHTHTHAHTHTRQVVVPAGQPCAGETVTFTVPASAVAGQQIRVPLPRSHAMTKVAAGCFRVQLPGNFAPNQVLQVTVPPGFPQSGQSTRFKVPPHMCPGQYVDVPLPSASGAAPVAQGSFRVRLPASAAPGAMLKVSVPAGYVEAGREQTFLVPPGAAPGSLVDVPLPAGGPFQPGVYHGAQVHTQASPASEPLRGVPLGGGVGNNLPQRAEEPDTSYADPPPKNFSV
jgi:hypothetical protein